MNPRIAILLVVAALVVVRTGDGAAAIATPALKSEPVLSYTAYGVYFCEARGAFDLLIYHDGTVLSTGQYACDDGWARAHTDVREYHFPAKRVTAILRRL